MAFRFLRRSAIEASLSEAHRQYLVGNLKLPQALTHISDEDIEFGISDYPDYDWEAAHSHVRAREFQYVLKGMTEYRDLDSNEVHRFCAGDFYVIYPGTRYIQRVKQDSRILFAKIPAGNDKVAEDVSEALLAWARGRLRVERLDLLAAEAPSANSLVPATAAAIIDDQQRLLMILRRDSGKWAMPGGTMQMGDSLASCIRREVLEETSIEVSIEGIIGTYSDPETRIVYSDGEVRREFSILFHCRPSGARVSLDDESTDAQWVALDSVLQLPMAASQRRRIEDVLAFVRNGAVNIR
ncbi:MAG: NUDIX domain-containing protein [Piscinibacter sp.]